MKFYFCEGCGKRVTDQNLADGLAKNKQLRGVFCAECAIGVTTITALPPPNNHECPPACRTSSEQGIPVLRSTRHAQHPSFKQALSNNKALPFTIGMMVLLTFSLAIVILQSSPKPIEERQKRMARPTNSAEPSVRHVPQQPQAPEKTDTSASDRDSEPSTRTPEPFLPNASLDQAEVPDHSQAPDSTHRPALAPLSPPPLSVATAKKLRELGEEVLRRLAVCRHDLARAAIDEAARLPEMVSEEKRLAAERCAINWHNDAIRSATTGAALLLDGRAIDLKTCAETLHCGKDQPDRIAGFAEGAFSVEHHEKGIVFSRKIPLANLAFETRVAIGEMVLTDDPLCHLKLAWLALADAAIADDEAEDRVSPLRDSIQVFRDSLANPGNLSRSVQDLIKDRLVWAEERLTGFEAAAEWDRIRQSIKGKRWKEAQSILQQWETRYRETAFYQKHSEEVFACRPAVEAGLRVETPARVQGDGKLLLHLTFGEEKHTIRSPVSENIAATIHSCEFVADGKFGRGLKLKGEKDVGNGLLLSFPKGTVKDGATVELWVKEDNKFETPLIAACWEPPVGLYFFGHRCAGDAATEGRWAHIAMVIKNKVCIYYVNGRRVNTLDHKGVMANLTQIRVGAGTVGPTTSSIYQFNGIIDNLKLWAEPLESFDLDKP